MSAGAPKYHVAGRLSGRGPRVVVMLHDAIDGHALARIETQPDTATLLRALGDLGLAATALDFIAGMVTDGDALGEHGVEHLRRTRERITEARQALAT